MAKGRQARDERWKYNADYSASRKVPKLILEETLNNIIVLILYQFENSFEALAALAGIILHHYPTFADSMREGDPDRICVHHHY